MIVPNYTIQTSKIPNAGQGLFLAQPIKKGSVIVAPDKIDRVFTLTEVLQSEQDLVGQRSSVRWFENYCTLCPEWPDECYINHAFNPTGLWHLGFVFALADLPVDTEVTIDYRFLLADGEISEFNDAQTGQPIKGLSWKENLQLSTWMLNRLINDF